MWKHLTLCSEPTRCLRISQVQGQDLAYLWSETVTSVHPPTYSHDRSHISHSFFTQPTHCLHNAQVQGQGPADLRSVTVTSVHPLALEHVAILRAHFSVCGRIVRSTALRDRVTGASPDPRSCRVLLQAHYPCRGRAMLWAAIHECRRERLGCAACALGPVYCETS